MAIKHTFANLDELLVKRRKYADEFTKAYLKISQKFGINFESFIEELKIETAWKQLMYKIYKEKVKINQEELEKQVYAYNYYQAQPRQVAGTDVRVAPVTGNRENIV